MHVRFKLVTGELHRLLPCPSFRQVALMVEPDGDNGTDDDGSDDDDTGEPAE